MTKLSLVSAFLIFAAVAVASAQDSSIQSQRQSFYNAIQNTLNDEQKQELQNAPTWQEKKALLKSWGVRPSFERFANLDPQTKSKIRDLKAQLRTAQTDEQRTEIRSQIRALFKSKPLT